MNVQGLIADAIYNSLQDQRFQPSINALYQNYALMQLNFILDEWRDKIPFGQEFTYTDASKLLSTSFISIQNITFVLNEVSSPLRRRDLTTFKFEKTVINLESVPQIYYFDELAQNIDIYPEPSQTNYSFIVWARINNVPVTLTEVIPTTIPPFMINALSFQLAYRLCTRFGRPWTEDKENQRLQLVNLLDSKLSIDLTPDPMAVFGSPKCSTTAPFPSWYYLSGGM